MAEGDTAQGERSPRGTPRKVGRPRRRPRNPSERPRSGRQFGANVRRLRVARGMTLDELARRVGYAGASMVSRIESGDKMPAGDRIRDIARALSAEISDLFDGV